jgi:rhodanese-related sulfurtransferase
MIHYITPERLNSWSRNFYQLFDITPAEFRRYRIPGVPWKPGIGPNDFKLLTRSPVLQCVTGMRASLLAARLVGEGVRNVHVLDGGITAWIDAGYMVEDA